MRAGVATVVATLIVVAVIVAFNAVVSYGGCHWYGYQTDRTVKYAAGVGCMVQKESGWTPKAELRTEQ